MLRKTVQIGTALTFILLLFTITTVYLFPHESSAGSWTFWGLPQENWEALQTNLGALLMVFVAAYLLLDNKSIISSWQSAVICLIIASVFPGWMILSTLYDLPPATWFPSAHLSSPAVQESEIADAAETDTMPEDPGRRYGRKTLGELCEDYHLNTAAIVEGLNEFGINASAGDSMRTIAENNSMTDGDIYTMVRQISLEDIGEDE